jgi:soluble lytic murein transglycosylase-like protein
LQNLEAGIAHLKRLLERYDGNLELALAGYNAGEGAVARYGGVPPFPETIRYVDRVMALATAR